MKGWRLRILIALAGLCAACATTSPTDGGTPVAAFGHCSSAALTKVSQGILGRVTTALATGDYVAQLAALAKEMGADEVGCAVDLVVAEFTAKAQRTDDTMVQVVLVHGQAWRAERP